VNNQQFVQPYFIWLVEGFLTTCSFDYMTEDASTKLFVGTIFVYSYVIPLGLLIFYYSKIVKHVHVHEHEQHLKAQAKKMNVTSLRSNAQQNESSAEVRICKVGLTLAGIFLLAWTPFAMVALIAAFGNRLV
jgi:r-opsin